MVKKGKVVSVSYSLKDEQGEELDHADAEDPFVYLHGAHQIVPGLEKALESLAVGDKKQVKISPNDAYGERDPGLELTVEKSMFPKGVTIEPGMQFEGSLGDEGEAAVFTVVSIAGDSVKIDGNHPLAGRTLHFDVEVLSVRDATAEELKHGHAHGPGGHGHDH
jgi:FKBP-type peptidyl-prolyl cis-trans isomerase SlyD